MISGEWILQLEEILNAQRPGIGKITAQRPVSGGSINNAWRLDTASASFFLKSNSKESFPGMFEAEAAGLDLLRETKTVRVPHVIASGDFQTQSWLLMEFLESGKRNTDYWEVLGGELAALHRHTHSFFGLETDNYMGSLNQINTHKGTWPEFFIVCRLEPQLDLARRSKAMTVSEIRMVEHLFPKLETLVPSEAPALIHGDLWNGNVSCGPDGAARVLDPAVYYGHREADLAMTRLFGGFDRNFYDAYQQAFPLHPGFESRADIHNLYPLLVHVNLFGRSYLQQVIGIANAFS